jgi:predicted unusual protein kinase regulating ubiquinone biosynthesis (AarF/ABC1/UbiB family)
MMTLNIEQLVAALPEEIDRELAPPATQALSDLLGAMGAQPLPVGALHRLWSMGTLQAKVALAYLSYWLRSSFAAAGERERLLNETHWRAALKTLAGMSYLRGIAMKTGQTLANYPNLLPEQFVEALSRLNFEAPPMHYALLREHVRNELGDEPENVFAEFDERAAAAASLGQVHRARLRSGEQVAVKIQYPGIDRTIDSDVSAVIALLSPMRLTREWDSLRAQLEDVRAMLRKETNYLQEAEYLRRGRSFRDDEPIVVPRVYERYSSQRVLTMDWLDGVHLDEYLRTYRSQAERDRYGELIMRASFRLAHTARLWYADSNPGNYLFLRDGRLGVIDFGCCREMSPVEWDYYVEMVYAHRAGGEALRRALLRAVGVTEAGSLPPQQMAVLEDMMHWYSDYLLIDAPFDFGNAAFIARGIELIRRLAENRCFRSLPLNVWISRQLLGLRSIAFRLGARINMKRLSDEEAIGAE